MMHLECTAPHVTQHFFEFHSILTTELRLIIVIFSKTS